eukprot:Hpha_TRINITY_DN11106_c0_g1::TRINITY_DN11106_c0_g1_i1::g.27960::m.27960
MSMDVVVNGLHPCFGQPDIATIFKACGQILSVNMYGGGAVGISFARPEQARLALLYDKEPLLGNTLSVQLHDDPSALKAGRPAAVVDVAPSHEEASSCQSVFLGPVPPDTTSEELRNLVEPQIASIGSITRITKNTGKGYAFLDFDSNATAQACVDLLNKQEIYGREVACRLNLQSYKEGRGKQTPTITVPQPAPYGYAAAHHYNPYPVQSYGGPPKQIQVDPGAHAADDEATCTSVFLGKVPPPETEDQIIHALMGMLGGQVQVQRVSKQTGKGFCFVEFDSPNSANQAVHLLDGRQYQQQSLVCRLNLNKHKHSRPGR